jgi:galactokinase
MREIEERAARAYQRRFGEQPELIASAPGRVNLIGEHTDYNGGFALPCAVDRRVAVAVGDKGSDEGSLYSDDFDDERSLWDEEGGWSEYPRGVARILGENAEHNLEFRAAFAGEVPRASGLSSSAAIESATALALDSLFELGLGRTHLALACQRAENESLGVQSGILDQYASLLCGEGTALLIDCRSLEAEPVPLDLEAAGLSLVVCDTRVERGLASAGTGYNDRRAACERAAEKIGVELLRDASEEDFERLSGEESEEELKRARHIVTENARVLACAEALRAGDLGRAGELMYASHASMRDDYEISTRELDTFVDLAREHGAIGARLTGAGFGGCALALVRSGEVRGLREAALRRFAQSCFVEPVFYEFWPAAGAEISG